MNQLITSNLDHIHAICEVLGVQKLSIFGSVCTPKFHKNSDVDFFVEFKKILSIDEYIEFYFELHYQLEALLNRTVDIVTANSLHNRYFIDSLEKNKILLYDRRNQEVFA